MKKPLVLSFANALIALSLGLGFAARAQDAKPGDVVAGEKKIAMCEGCHNLPRYQASFPEIYKVPMIAGQNAKYIATALAGYRKGERKHPTMRAIAGSLSDQDIADVAAYYAQLGSPAARRPRPRRPPRQRRRTRRAAGRRAADQGQLRLVPRQQLQRADRPVVSEAGRPARRLPVRRAEGLPDRPQPGHVGRNNAIMMGMARPFTQPEIKAIAAYLGSLPGDLKTVEQPRFR